MLARNVSIRLKSNTVHDFQQTSEKELNAQGWRRRSHQPHVLSTLWYVQHLCTSNTSCTDTCSCATSTPACARAATGGGHVQPA